MSKPIIALAGMEHPPVWLPELQASLNDDYTLHKYGKNGYVHQLADDYVALILVDGDADDWVYWTATPKSSSATRRIPIFLITENAEVRREGLNSGADLGLTPANAIKDLPRLAHEYARIFDPARAKQLDCECQQALPELAERGFAEFNQREFYKQHDSFEALWMETDGPVRDLYRAILQVGVAYYQIERGNARGALKMLLRSVQWLAVLPDQCQGIDVAALRADSYRVRAELERVGEDGLSDFDLSLLKPVKKVDVDG